MGSGFEIIKRPGLNRFIQEMGKCYEVVIFGTEDSGVNKSTFITFYFISLVC